MTVATAIQTRLPAPAQSRLPPDQPLRSGVEVVARLLALAGDGTAEALIGDLRLTLLLAGPLAQAATLKPGDVLRLRIDGRSEGGALTATLLETASGGEEADIRRAATAEARLDGPIRAGQAPVQPEIASAPPPPRAVAGALIAPALARQDGLAPLYANLQELVAGRVALVLPSELLDAARILLAQRLDPAKGGLTPAALARAVSASGLFGEARTAATGTAAQDLKAGLASLRTLLEPLLVQESDWAAGQPLRPAVAGQSMAVSLQAAAPDLRLPPPLRDAAPVAQGIAEPSLTAGAEPLAVAATLLRQTEAALDRITLAQFAALPPEGQREGQTPQRWLTEIPIALPGGTAVLPLAIEREPPRREAEPGQGATWRLRFSLDGEPLGPLHGLVTLQGRAVSVSLRAEREQGAQVLRRHAHELDAALEAADFETRPTEIVVGAPPRPAPRAGLFLDRRT